MVTNDDIKDINMNLLANDAAPFELISGSSTATQKEFIADEPHKMNPG